MIRAGRERERNAAIMIRRDLRGSCKIDETSVPDQLACFIHHFEWSRNVFIGVINQSDKPFSVDIVEEATMVRPFIRILNREIIWQSMKTILLSWCLGNRKPWTNKATYFMMYWTPFDSSYELFCCVRRAAEIINNARQLIGYIKHLFEIHIFIHEGLLQLLVIKM